MRRSAISTTRATVNPKLPRFGWRGARLGIVAVTIGILSTWGGPDVWGADLELAKENPVRNGALDQLDDNARPAHWTVASGRGEFAVVQPADAPTGGSALQVKLAAGGSVVLSQDVAVADDVEYLVSAQVRSTGAETRVVARVGQLTMSYNDPGRWQRVVGLVSPTRDDKRTIRLELRALGDEPATVLLQDVSLHRSERPEAVGPRPTYGPTTLIDQGQPEAYIVYGHKQADIAEPAARRIAAAIEQRTGVQVPVRRDDELTDANQPVIDDRYRDSHLILLGRLATNRAIWPSYNRFLCAVDDYYPGGEGYVVRTAANVFGNGRNHLIVGASGDAGLERAADAFIAQLDTAEMDAPDSEQATFTLPWLLDVEVDGECRAALKARDELWSNDPENRLLPPTEPGYGTVRRWYQNAMGYYWTGWDSYRQRAVDYLEPVLADRAYTHHYIAEFLVRTYMMLDDSDLFDDEQRARLDHLILTNFLDFMGESGDLGWMTTFAPPYENIAISNRHQIAPWTADVMMADFLHDHLDWGEDLQALIDFRRAEKHRFFEHVLRHRWRPSGAATSSHYEELAAAMLRYALHHEHYTFFERGHAHRALPLERINHRTGMLVQPAGRIDHHLLLGILAHYHEDGRYAWLLDNLPRIEHPTGPFQGRYVAGVRRYHADHSFEPAAPTSWAGVRTTPLSSHDRYAIGRISSGLFHRADFDMQEAVDLLTFREGFEPGDDHVAITGVHGPDSLPGIFANFTSGGEQWLGSSSTSHFAPASGRYFDQNGVSVIRTDQWLDDSQPFPAVGRLDARVNLQQGGAGEVRAEPFMDTRWSRRVVWVRPGLYVVRDTVTALEAGTYQVRVNWRPEGQPNWDGTAWTSTQGDQRFRLTPLGARFSVDQNVDAFLSGQARPLQFGHVAAAELDAGESLTATAVIEVAPRDEPMREARLLNADHLWLKRAQSEADGEDMHVLFNGVEMNDVQTDAATLVVTPSALSVMQATSLRLGDRALLNAPEPISLTLDQAGEQAWLDLGDGEALAFDADEFASADHAGETVAQRVEALALSPDEPASIWRPLQSWANAQPTPSVAERADDSAERDATIEDAVAAWRVAWQYEGLKRPGLVRDTRRVAEDVVDLGRTVTLAEIRARRLTSGPWQPSPLPGEFWAAEPDPETGGMPARDSDAWQRLPEPQWRPSVRTGNYGEAHPVDEGYQVVRPGNIRARYVRAERAHLWYYYDADTPRSREPVRLEAHDVTGDGQPEILAATDVSSDWPRERITEDAAFALLDADGQERFVHDPEVNMQVLRVLDFDGRGEKRVVMVRWDGRIRIFEADGSMWRDLDLYQMHQDFHAREGRSNTRQPAGGFVTPYGFGLWDPDGDGKRRVVIARYGRFSFLDAQGQFEGVLDAVGYAMRGVLPYGIDFDGDGQEEQVALERFRVIHLEGESEPYVTDPTGRAFYPQVHRQSWLRQPDSPGNLAGAPVLRFEPIAWGESSQPRYVLIVRESFLGIYDGRERDWAYTWVPLVGLRSATVVRDEADRLRIVATTQDSLLWQLDWTDTLAEHTTFHTTPLPDQINRIAAASGTDSTLWMAGRQGLYRLDADGRIARVAAGTFYDVLPIVNEGGSVETLLATTVDGTVQRVDRAGEE